MAPGYGDIRHRGFELSTVTILVSRMLLKHLLSVLNSQQRFDILNCVCVQVHMYMWVGGQRSILGVIP